LNHDHFSFSSGHASSSQDFAEINNSVADNRGSRPDLDGSLVERINDFVEETTKDLTSEVSEQVTNVITDIPKTEVTEEINANSTADSYIHNLSSDSQDAEVTTEIIDSAGETEISVDTDFQNVEGKHFFNFLQFQMFNKLRLIFLNFLENSK
jgi:hypothetical protein